MARVWPDGAFSSRMMSLLLFSTIVILCSLVPSAISVEANGVKTTGSRGESAAVVVSPSAGNNNIWKPYTSTPDAVAGVSCTDEYSCLSARMSESERLALEAIRTLHAQLDDDANGNIDLSESDEFLREELHYTGGHERRQKAFHRDDDMHISVRELWDIWKRSEVHNWTTEQTTEWLVHFVELPQYASHFRIHNINGTKLPRLAVNNVHFFSSVLGIKDPIHRQKIAVKAMDVVLFGPPRDTYSYYKDLTLVTLLVAAVAGGWYTYRTQRNSKRHLTKLMQHMEILSSAEKELQELQAKLQHAREEQDIVLSEKLQLERKLEQETHGSNSSLFTADPTAELELRRLREEVDILRSELQRAEGELEDRLCWAPPPELQHWLQLTYELEQRAYNKKRLQAEKQLEQAKDACEKLNRKRSSFVASFVSTHGRTIDDVDKSILEARSSLMEVKQDLQERTTRWRQIESLCGFPIATNPGLNYLETLLRNSLGSSRYVVLNPTRQGTLDEDGEMGDETSSLVSSSAAAGPPVASAASTMPYTEQRNRSGQQQPPPPPQQQQQRKYPLPKRESSVSLESASALISQLNGNGLSSHSISLSELPKSTTTATLQRQKLSQRENSKDSAFAEGSTISSGLGCEEVEQQQPQPSPQPPARPSVLIKPPALIHPVSKTEAGSSSPGSVHKTLPETKVTSLSAGHGHTAEPSRKSPLLGSKVATPRNSPLPPRAAVPPESPDLTGPSTSFKYSQSDSALDAVFQQAQAQAEAESSAHEENASTDSSILSADEETRKSIKKKQRFHFPSLMKRNKNKT